MGRVECEGEEGVMCGDLGYMFGECVCESVDCPEKTSLAL